ncbi:MAG: CCA tRNA nucleotidyltransferase [Planctomycetota bacterium]
MTTSSPPREFAVEIVRKLRAAGHTALLAGGCVRDLLLGREPKDYDVATTARPEQVRELFGHRRTLAVGASFGVIVVTGPREAGHVEVATFRTEGPYHDGRRPESVAFCTPEEDAQRRDFTINGMFYDPIDARVLDFVGGEADLAARVLRAIGDPHERMREDKLRMLRAVRFAATLDFALDEITAAAVREMADEIVVVSQERIAQELRRMLVDPHRRRAVELCADVRLLNVILPELGGEREPEGIRLPLRKLDELTLLQQPSFELAFATLLHSLPARPVVYDICHRLRLSNDETDRIEWLVAHQDDLADAPSQMPARLKRTLAHPYRDDLIALLRVKRLAHAADMQPVLFCDEYLAKTPQSIIDPPPLMTGDDLKSLGLKPGPEFRTLLDAVRDAQLNGEIATHEQALVLVNTAIGRD